MPPHYTSSAAHSFQPTPTPTSTTATATQTLTSTPVLRLRATAPPPQTTRTPRIQWAEDVVDNEGLGRKSSKVCCIYHAPRPAGESSSDESSSSDSGSSSDDNGAARMSGNRKVKARHRDHQSDKQEHQHGEVQDPHRGHQNTRRQHAEKTSKQSGNAYERMPKSKGESDTIVEANP